MTTTDLTARVADLSDKGFDEKAIAGLLAVPVARVERILDQQVGAPPGEALQTVTAKPKPERAPGFKHGTISGYQAHKRHGQEPCEDCKAGAREYWNARDVRRHKAKATKVPVTCLLCPWTGTAATQAEGTAMFKEHYRAEHPPLAKQPRPNLPTPPEISPAGQAVLAGQLDEYRVIWPDGTHSDITADAARTARDAGLTILRRQVTAWAADPERTSA